jgi:hypothetical protein
MDKVNTIEQELYGEIVQIKTMKAVYCGFQSRSGV